MAKLYELTGQIKELQELSDDPEMAQAVADTLEGLEMALEEKAEGILRVIQNRDADLKAIKDEIDRLTVRKKRMENFNKQLKDYLRFNMEASSIKKIECPLFTITLAAGRDVVAIDNADKLPDEYIEIKMVAQPIQARILKALKAGAEIPGAHIEKSQSSIRIK